MKLKFSTFLNKFHLMKLDFFILMETAYFLMTNKSAKNSKKDIAEKASNI